MKITEEQAQEIALKLEAISNLIQEDDARQNLMGDKIDLKREIKTILNLPGYGAFRWLKEKEVFISEYNMERLKKHSELMSAIQLNTKLASDVLKSIGPEGTMDLFTAIDLNTIYLENEVNFYELLKVYDIF